MERLTIPEHSTSETQITHRRSAPTRTAGNAAQREQLTIGALHVGTANHPTGGAPPES
ncbi:MAG: hypothetical protein ACLSG5_05635 [Oscillospiraceae bacterium]